VALRLSAELCGIIFKGYTEMHRVYTELHGEKYSTMETNKITQLIIGKAIEVHRTLGPGLLESAYQECLYYELKLEGLKVEKEISLPIVYKEVKLDHGYRIDLLVENKVVVELKHVEALSEVHEAQVLTYLKLGNYEVGLLINFNEKLLKNGLKRYINSNK
jgi:GxxExxY protein